MKQFDRLNIACVLKEGAADLPIQINDVQLNKLMDYLALLAKWNGVYNLTAIRDPEQMVVQHLLDSLSAVPAFVQANNVLDVGSGGGLPGMVLAIWAAENRPAMQVSMIDTVHKKTAFLTQVKAELNLKNITVYTGRVEQLEVAQKFDVITSRAFAELADFVNWSAHLLAEGGRFIAMKGAAPSMEINRLPPGWRVQQVDRLSVPTLQAERHLVFIQKDTSAKTTDQ